ncbi:MAG: class B sortase [Oscillospiraceae bacterium]|nr:class B sortase [Oscillospiraceae bacterium]
MEKRKVVRTVLVLLIIAALCVIGYCGWYIYQYYMGESLGREIRGSWSDTDIDTDAQKIVIPVDFEELWGINKDIYAWISIPDTDISYPIVQRDGDNNFYVRRSEAGVYYSGGCIYTEDFNKKDFSDPLTVVYGHNLRSGRMFAQLNSFSDPEFFKEHKYIYVFLPDRALVYDIFAAVPYKSWHLLSNVDMNDPEVRAEFFGDIMGILDTKANFRNLQPDYENDRFIALSTCLEGNNTQRFLVFGVLREEIPAA